MMRQWAISELKTSLRNTVSGVSARHATGAKYLAAVALLGAMAIAAPLSISAAQAQAVPMDGLKLSDSKDPVAIGAEKLEMRDKDGVAVFTGNVQVKQGDVELRTGSMEVYYGKSKDSDEKAKSGIGGLSGAGLGAGGIEKLVVKDKVYLKSGTQVATGDEGTYDAKTQTMVLTGKKVVLSDGDNIATGCKLTANTQTGKAFLESCKGQSGRVSIILSPKSQ